MKKKLTILRHNAEQLLSLRFFQVVGAISLIFLGFSFILPVWRLFPDIQDKVAIPLHYNIHFGVDLFGTWQRIFMVPIVGSVIFLVNYIIAILFWRKEKVLSYFLGATVLFSEILALVAIIFIVLLNITYG